MGLKFSKASDFAQVFVKVLLYGLSGVGKTWAAASAGADPARVLVALCEAQGRLQVAQSNPQATVVEINSWGDWLELQKLMGMKHSGCSGEGCDDCRDTGLEMRARFDLLVVDGYTDLQRYSKLLVETASDRPRNNQSLREGVLGMDDWQVVGNMMLRQFSGLRDVPIHVVATCIGEEQQDGDVLRARPYLQGQAKATVGQFHSLVACLRTRADDQGNVERYAILDSPNRSVIAKGNIRLNAIEPVNVADWISKVLGQIPPQVDAPSAPEPQDNQDQDNGQGSNDEGQQAQEGAAS